MALNIDERVEVYFDLGELTSTGVFILDDSTYGVLAVSGGTDYPLGGDLPVDITDYVESYSLSRGRATELDEITAGTLTVDISDITEARFLPDEFVAVSASPYGSNLLPGKRVTVSAGGKPIFDGKISDWNARFSGDRYKTVSFTAADDLSLLARRKLDTYSATDTAAGARITTVLDRSEISWPLGNRDIDTGDKTLGTITVDQDTNALEYLQLIARSDRGRLFIAKNGALTFRDANSVVASSSSVEFGGIDGPIYYADLDPNGARYSIPSGTFTTWPWGGDFTILARIRLSDYSPGGAVGDYICRQWDGASERAVSFRMTGTGLLELTWTTDGTGATEDFFRSSTALQTASGVSDGDAIWTAVTWREDNGSSSSEVRFWWAPDSLGVPHSDAWSQVGTTDTVGAVDSIYATADQEFYVGSEESSVGDLKLYHLDVLSDIDADTYKPGRTSVILFDPEAVDGGTSELTWTAAGSATISSETITQGVPFVAVRLIYGDDQLYNVVEVGGSLVATQTSENTDAQDTYGIRVLSLTDLLLANDTSQASDIADALLAIYQEPIARVELELSYDIMTGAQQGQVVGLELGDRVTLTWKPWGALRATSKDYAVEGVSHDASHGNHVGLLRLSPILTYI